ncbi:hypothetical protein OKW33_004640 [Paraburkholderia atlantica]|uniref:Uncharacterized protein n=1 Tax=Paraburkholderia atlantica TaxID=2654982 RepID=D5WIB9_PARAM|nr:DUF1653 domain-containing protein [Paraburkholderia atlantica]ADG18214.1 protein of unknown function DUF1653 [Paraburkholderia atlantica]MBB5504452.1 hypothetical protein [Paraburkholderia atlantica]
MRYRHYKGGIYELVCEATLESDPTVTMIVYKAANGTIWTRPATVFFELVEQDGVKVPRFAPLDELNNEADASRSD